MTATNTDGFDPDDTTATDELETSLCQEVQGVVDADTECELRVETDYSTGGLLLTAALSFEESYVGDVEASFSPGLAQERWQPTIAIIDGIGDDVVLTLGTPAPTLAPTLAPGTVSVDVTLSGFNGASFSSIFEDVEEAACDAMQSVLTLPADAIRCHHLVFPKNTPALSR